MNQVTVALPDLDAGWDFYSRFVYFGNAGTPYPAVNTIYDSVIDRSVLRLTVRPAADDKARI
ncbi:hypothetical protein [Nitratireductor soli]|uniref:hypothetical protein n=1 Tax=Nitratireductor soli TaxID=1670619 RepID=UPI000A7ED085|nr:hypothetical protein [Nitratireductor soli]